MRRWAAKESLAGGGVGCPVGVRSKFTGSTYDPPVPSFTRRSVEVVGSGGSDASLEG